MKTHEKYITEAVYKKGFSNDAVKKAVKPYPKGQNIKDMAVDFNGEIETMIANLINDWENHGEFEDMRTADIKKMVAMAIKNINLSRIL